MDFPVLAGPEVGLFPVPGWLRRWAYTGQLAVAPCTGAGAQRAHPRQKCKQGKTASCVPKPIATSNTPWLIWVISVASLLDGDLVRLVSGPATRTGLEPDESLRWLLMKGQVKGHTHLPEMNQREVLGTLVLFLKTVLLKAVVQVSSQGPATALSPSLLSACLISSRQWRSSAVKTGEPVGEQPSQRES